MTSKTEYTSVFVSSLMFTILAAICAPTLGATELAKVDILFKGGTIIDGAGGEPFVGDVAVQGDKIVAVGEVDAKDAAKTIDCTGLVICPGFIDLHNHSDESMVNRETRDGRCYATQGCTTLVTGNCGGGQREVGEYYDEMAQQGIGINVAHLIPHGSIRDQVMGKVRRAPTAEELKQMQDLADVGMREGAWGMSTGLQYVPGSYADLDEIVAIATVVGQHGGIYASHIRDEGDELLESIEEVLQIGRRAHLPCHVSHLKSSKKANWGKIRAAAHLIEEARQQGLRVTADQYPYNASSTSIMAMLLPDEEREGGEQATAERLKSDPALVERLRPIVAESLAGRGPIMVANIGSKPEWIGKMIADIAKQEERDQVDVAFDILRDGRASGVNFSMDEADVRYAMTLPWVATASDGSVKNDDGTRPHPRSYGTFARKIGHYSIKENALPLPAAIRSASGLPADILGLHDRGYVRENLAADLVVLDPKTYADQATYEKPFEEAKGVRWLLVNGQVAIADGALQDTLAGRPLRRNPQPRAAQ